MTKRRKTTSGPKAKSKPFQKSPASARQTTASRPQFVVQDSPRFSLLDVARNTGQRRLDWTPETKLRYTKVNFVTAGLYDPTTEDNVNWEDCLCNRGAQEDTESLARSFGSATAFVPMSSRQPGSQSAEIWDDTLFVIDTEGCTPAFKPTEAPMIRSPSPAALESSDEEVVFVGRRSQASHGEKTVSSKLEPNTKTVYRPARVVEDPVFTKLPSLVLRPSQAPTSSQPSRSSAAAAGSLSKLSKLSNDTPTTDSKPWDDTPVEWVHRSKPGIGWSVPRAKAKITTDPVSRRYIVQDEVDEEEEEEEEEAIIQDYIDNTKSEERFSHNVSFLQYRELDIQMGRIPLSTTIRSKVIEGTGSDEDTSEDEYGNRVSRFKGKVSGKGGSNSDAESSSDDLEELDEDDSEEDDGILDDADLIQRCEDGIDDEVLARLLAKQESLGIDAEDLVLLDDATVSTFDIQSEAQRYAKNSAKRSRRSGNSFPSATLMADVLEQDPYGGFDIMDFDRPSLRPKNKGRKAKPAFDMSDSELEEALQSSWKNDREKKRACKAEREVMRMQGLLGKKNKSRPNLSDIYQEGLNVGDLEEVFRNFLLSARLEQPLPPMDKFRRKMVHELASAFNMISKSKGKKQKRFPILIKTSRTTEWNASVFNTRTKKMNSGFFPRLDAQARTKTAGSRTSGRTAGGGGNAPGTRYKDGDVVGAAAPELGAENRGRAMLEKMGWAAGTGLGATENKGILQPIVHVVKNSRSGLG